MAALKILAIEDEIDILDLVKYHMSKEGYRITGVQTGEAGLEQVRKELPDLILLDLMLPNINGVEVCKMLKRNPETRQIPIVMLTAKGEEGDVVSGLEMGADDYVTKPFSPRVLLARVKSVIRRYGAKDGAPEMPIERDELLIHPGRREATIGDNLINLTYSEFQALYFLASRPGWVFTRFQIVNAIRGDDYPVTDRSVDVMIVGLRKKLGEYGRLIETVRGVGYRFIKS